MFISNKPFSELLNILPEMFIFLKTPNSDFTHIDVWFVYLNSNLLEKKEKINTSFVIN